MKQKYKISALCAAAMLTGIIPSQAADIDLEQEQTGLISDSLASLVNMPFRVVDNNQLLGGVSTVDYTALSKKSFNTYSLEDMSSLVSGYNGQLWNMGDVLVLVDGVPRDATSVSPSEIDKITFLKGAQAIVLYGSRAAKGAILITTKRGTGEGLQINIHGNAGLYTPKRYVSYLAPGEYMTYYNQALQNDGLERAYTDEQIWRYASKDNIFRYPSTNFYSEDYVKKHYERYEGIAEFSGGGSFAKFYANISLWHQTDLMNFGEGKDNHSTKLNVRGNIDLKLNKYITGFVNANASFYDARNDRSNFWSESSKMRPVTTDMYPLVPLIPISAIESGNTPALTLVNNSHYIVDGKYILGGTQNYQTNPFAAMYAAGYSKQTSRQMQFDAGINIDMSTITPGLKFATQVGVDYATGYLTSIENSYAVYQADWYTYQGKDYIGSLTKFGEDRRDGSQHINNSSDRQTIMFSAQLDYTRTFADVNNFEAQLIAHGYQNSESGVYHRTSNANLGLRLAYNYANRYYAEFQAAAVHSAKLAPGHRNGFSPVGTIGWNIHNEDFLKDSNWLSSLKLNATFGELNEDIDITEYYMYQDVWSLTSTWWGWNEVSNALQTADLKHAGNSRLGFVKRREFNVGLDASFFERALMLNVNFYNIDLRGLPVNATSLFPNYLSSYYPASSFIPYVNYNNQRRTGVDMALSFVKQFGDFKVGLGLNAMYYKSKNTRVDEITAYDWLKNEGQSISAMRGYHCLGFFNSEEEIAQSACVDKDQTKPGDLKYEDLNGDGIIDSNDQMVIGDWTSPWNLGVNLTLSYKGFTLFAAGAGNFGGTVLKNSAAEWVYGDGKYTDIVRGAWTPETAATATYPRLTTQSGDLNFVTSDFWTDKLSAFYINKIQLTYDFPANLFSGNKVVKGVTLYVSADNLATISKHSKHLETNVGKAPQCREYNFGFQVNF